jgi:hypothetical protein
MLDEDLLKLDEDLLKMVYLDSDQYLPEALTYAKAEIRQRRIYLRPDGPKHRWGINADLVSSGVWPKPLES